ncbi:hypothetical protein Fcan01_19163 [Folsomia candida]|uniref:Gustatory receptor n=1 Tax=Folsomia candida TaxID=158441 RepID=A0A226DL96_FOLCA|nr:hypothetical protein Fcan01_19163 [Folsomia candida]
MDIYNIWPIVQTYMTGFRYLWRFPIYFIPRDKAFVHLRRDSFQYRVWAAVVPTNMVLFLLSSIGILLWANFSKTNVPSISTIMNGTMMALFGTFLSLFHTLTGFGAMRWMEECTYTGNQLAKDRNDLIRVKSSTPGTILLPRSKTRLRLEIKFLQQIMLQVSLTPFIIIPVLLFTGYPSLKPTLLGRCFNIFFCAFEGFRMIGCVGVILFMRILAYVSYLNELSNLLKCKKRSKFTDYKDVLRFYDRIRLSFKHEHEMISNFSALVLFTMFTVLLTNNFICLKMHHVFPPHFFAFFPTTNLTAYGVLHLGFYAVLLATNKSAGVLAEIGGKLASSVRIRIRRKWLQRRMKSVNKLQVPVGIGNVVLFHFSKDTRTTFYLLLLDNTINLLLSVYL